MKKMLLILGAAIAAGALLKKKAPDRNATAPILRNFRTKK